MDKHDARMAFDFLIALLGTTCHFLFGGWSKPLVALVVLMAADFISGTLAAHKTGEYNSRLGKQGVGRKLAYLLFVVIGRMIDLLLSQEQPIFQTMATYGLAGHEIGSFIENMGKAGYWIPAALKKGMAQLRKQGGETDEI